MLIVTNKNQTEPITKYNNFQMDEEVNYAFTVSFTSFNLDNPGHGLIEEEALISVADYDFRIKQMKEVKNRKEVIAVSTFYDLVGHRQEDIYGGTHTVGEFVGFILNGTGWTYSSDITSSALIPNFGVDNIIKLVQGLCQAFECEFKIMPNNHVHFSKQIGPDNDAQYRYGHNVKALSKSVDTTNLRTKIKGYGADNLVVTYTSPNAEVFGIIEAEPVHDDRFTIGENLIEHIKKGLIDYPEVTLELDTVELTYKELGERVWLIYEPLNIEFQTRVLAKKSTMRNGELITVSVVLGNSMPKTLGDILASQKVEIDENKKQVMSRFEQVNDRITMEVEEVGSSISGLEITVGEVRLYAEKLGNSLAEIAVKTDNITLSVQTLGDRLGSAESQLSIQAEEIATKVSETDYNGNTMISRINQTAGSVKIQAENIDLLGIATVSQELNIGGDWKDSEFKAINFRGALGEVGISSPTTNNLQINAALGYVNFDTWGVDFSGADRVDLSRTNITWGSNKPSYPEHPRFPSHQQNVEMGVDSNGRLRVTVNGRTARFEPISWE